jgi:hypothetical protein
MMSLPHLSCGKIITNLLFKGEREKGAQGKLKKERKRKIITSEGGREEILGGSGTRR